ncbi:MAG: hypothetical protein U0V75_08395 [Ferruginibacter sp.]
MRFNIYLTLVLLIAVHAVCFAQYEISIPVAPADRISDIKAYYNPYSKNFVIAQQGTGMISRQLFDTVFQLKKSYTAGTEAISFSASNKKHVFLEAYCTAGMNYEVYSKEKSIEIWAIGFENGADKKAAALRQQQQYKDERLVALIPGADKLTLLCITPKENKLLLYNYFPGKDILLQGEYPLPAISLTPDEIKERGRHLAMQYSNSMRGIFIAETNKTGPFHISPGNQLLYNDTALYFLLRVPYKAGYHLLEMNRTSGQMRFSNFLVNKLEAGHFGTSYEMIPAATMYDSLLIIQNSNSLSLEYYFYNIHSGQLLAKHTATADNSLYSIVHSGLHQAGTYGSKDEEKDISSERLFLRRKNKGNIFINVSHADADSILLSFGSYVPTEGIGGSIVGLATLFATNFVSGAFKLGLYMSMTRNKFLFAFSKFSLKTFEPSRSTGITTPLNTIVSETKADEPGTKSSFVIEKDGHLYTGNYDKVSDKFRIIKY